jgi:predicted extracellular nuclease
MRFLFLFLLPLFLNAIQIKIASYNVENLFDMVNNGTEYTAYKPKKHNWTRTTLNKKLLNISETICDINADIIGLQEIENENILKLLQKSLRSTGCYYKYLAITHKKKSAIQVAVLSKIPITNAKEIVVNKKLKYRNILEVKFMIEDRPFFVYVNHWTSKNSAESKRILSAQVLKKRLDKLPKDMDYILLGDFNSDYNEYKHMEVQHNDTHGKTGINHILKTIINHRLVNKNNIYKDNGLHYNLWLELPNFQRWSHNFYGKKQGLDAIILPHSMFDGKGIDYNNNSFKVIKSPYLFHKKVISIDGNIKKSDI